MVKITRVVTRFYLHTITCDLYGVKPAEEQTRVLDCEQALSGKFWKLPGDTRLPLFLFGGARRITKRSQGMMEIIGPDGRSPFLFAAGLCDVSAASARNWAVNSIHGWAGKYETLANHASGIYRELLRVPQ